MKIINGLIFGAGLGLLTAAASGIADQYALALVVLGGLFITAEITRILLNKPQ